MVQQSEHVPQIIAQSREEQSRVGMDAWPAASAAVAHGDGRAGWHAAEILERRTFGAEGPLCPGEALREMAEGDSLAFERLFQVMAPKVMAYLLERGIPPKDAEDVAVAAMVVIWQRAGAFDRTKDSPAAFIFRMLRDLTLARGLHFRAAPS